MPGLGLSADRGKRKYRLCRRRGGGGLDASIQSSSSAPFSSLAMLASLAVAMAIFFILVLLDVFQSELIVSEGFHVAGGVVECMVRKIHHSMSMTRVREPTRRGINDNDDSRQSTQSVNCNQVPSLMADKPPPLQIVILAGQSNMVGMGSMEHLDLLVHEGCRPRNTAGGGYESFGGPPPPTPPPKMIVSAHRAQAFGQPRRLAAVPWVDAMLRGSDQRARWLLADADMHSLQS
jgi:hypothetical protein